MPRKRYCLFLCMAAVVSVLAFAAWTFAPRRSSAITRDNAAKIQPGMTLEEVDAILGGPERDEAGEAFFADWSAVVSFPQPPGDIWIGPQAAVAVAFSENHVRKVVVADVRPRDNGVFALIRRWLRL